MTESLISAAQPFLPTGVTFRAGELGECTSAIQAGQDYLYVEQPVGFTFIATHSHFASQTFRKAIAAQQGVIEKFDWKEYPEVENIEATLARIEQRVLQLEAS